jgi:hypothetical protein
MLMVQQMVQVGDALQYTDDAMQLMYAVDGLILGTERYQ